MRPSAGFARRWVCKRNGSRSTGASKAAPAFDDNAHRHRARVDQVAQRRRLRRDGHARFQIEARVDPAGDQRKERHCIPAQPHRRRPCMSAAAPALRAACAARDWAARAAATSGLPAMVRGDRLARDDLGRHEAARPCRTRAMRCRTHRAQDDRRRRGHRHQSPSDAPMASMAASLTRGSIRRRRSRSAPPGCPQRSARRTSASAARRHPGQSPSRPRCLGCHHAHGRGHRRSRRRKARPSRATTPACRAGTAGRNAEGAPRRPAGHVLSSACRGRRRRRRCPDAPPPLHRSARGSPDRTVASPSGRRRALPRPGPGFRP